MIFWTATNPTNRRSSTHHRHVTTNGIIDIAMCRASIPPPNDGVCKATNIHGRSSLSATSMAPLPAIIASNLASVFKPTFSLRRFLLLVAITSFVSFASLYTFHRGFRRTIQFWRGMAPLVVRYKYVTIKAERIDKVGPEEMERRLNSYRESTAPRLVDLILRMGGIYVKIGQGEKRIAENRGARIGRVSNILPLLMRFACDLVSDGNHRTGPSAAAVPRCPPTVAGWRSPPHLRGGIRHHNTVDREVHGRAIH